MKCLICVVLISFLSLSLNQAYAQFDSDYGASFRGALSDTDVPAPAGPGGIAPAAAPVAAPPQRAAQQEACVWRLTLETGERVSFTAAPITGNMTMDFPSRGNMSYLDREYSPNLYPRSDFGLVVTPLSMSTTKAGDRVLRIWEELDVSILEASDKARYRKAHVKAQALTSVRLRLIVTPCPFLTRVLTKYSGSGSAISGAYAGDNCSAANKIKIAGSLGGNQDYLLTPGNVNTSFDRRKVAFEVTGMKLPLFVVAGDITVNARGTNLNLGGVSVGTVVDQKKSQSGGLQLTGGTEESTYALPYSAVLSSFLDIDMSASSDGDMSQSGIAMAGASVSHRIDTFKGVLLNDDGEVGATDFSLEMAPQKRSSWSNEPACDLPLTVTVGAIKQSICVDSLQEKPDGKPFDASQLNLSKRLLLTITGNKKLNVERMDAGVNVRPEKGVTVTGP